ncbi:MAG: hypothetical protein K0S29_1230 [Gammaproteobacteria bacterium]|jgi:hypothetical protein|nr:hypothetical protein [Gammaproteobacteria bacterium]
MNAKKFLIIVLLFGILRICHAIPQQFTDETIFMPQVTNSSVKIYPCFACVNIARISSSTANGFQTSIGMKLVF